MIQGPALQHCPLHMPSLHQSYSRELCAALVTRTTSCAGSNSARLIPSLHRSIWSRNGILCEDSACIWQSACARRPMAAAADAVSVPALLSAYGSSRRVRGPMVPPEARRLICCARAAGRGWLPLQGSVSAHRGGCQTMSKDMQSRHGHELT